MKIGFTNPEEGGKLPSHKNMVSVRKESVPRSNFRY